MLSSAFYATDIVINILPIVSHLHQYCVSNSKTFEMRAACRGCRTPARSLHVQVHTSIPQFPWEVNHLRKSWEGWGQIRQDLPLGQRTELISPSEPSASFVSLLSAFCASSSVFSGECSFRKSPEPGPQPSSASGTPSETQPVTGIMKIYIHWRDVHSISRGCRILLFYEGSINIKKKQCRRTNVNHTFYRNCCIMGFFFLQGTNGIVCTGPCS